MLSQFIKVIQYRSTKNTNLTRSLFWYIRIAAHIFLAIICTTVLETGAKALETGEKKEDAPPPPHEKYSPSDCLNHKSGDLMKLTSDAIKAKKEDDNIQQTKKDLENYVSSCVTNYINMDSAKASEIAQEFQNVVKWFELMYSMLLFSPNPSLQANLDSIKVIIQGGNNIYASESYGWKIPFDRYFYIGYEGTTVDQVNNKGSTRIGVYFYNQFRNLTEICPIKSVNSKSQANDSNEKCGIILSTIPHFYGNIFQTSSAESSTDTTSGTNTQTKQTNIVNSMEVNTGIFWPILTFQEQEYNGREGVLATGPIAEHGWKMNTGGRNFVQREYFGVRSAFSQDIYVDLMYGSTDGLTGKRIEIRGQMPVVDFSVGLLFLGCILNYSHGKLAQDTDSLRIYAIYRASFSDF